MTLEKELSIFRGKYGFCPYDDSHSLTVRVHASRMLIPLPNIKTRNKYLKYHDVHHLVTGYGVGPIGEGEVSAWELGTGSFFINPILGIMNFIALSTGLFLHPKRMWRAFSKGYKSKNLYQRKHRHKVDSGRWNNIEAIATNILEIRDSGVPISVRAIVFAVYSILALCIHVLMVVLTISAWFITDIALGYNFYQSKDIAGRTGLS